MNEILGKYIGAACEVKTLDNNLLFLGRVSAVVEGLSLSLDIVSTDGSALIGSRYGAPVKLSLYKNASNMLIVGGKVYMANAEFWRISNISQYQNYERRGFFRVQASSECTASMETFKGETAEKVSARLVNISLSGIMFSSLCKFAESRVVNLDSVFLAQDKWPFTFRCKILRSDEESKAGFIHRAQFLDMDQRESDRLCKAIFALQREAIKKRKNRF